MDQIKTDILISGGGVAGLVAAASFGAAGFDVVCVDPTPPVTDRNAEGADLRTTAFLQPAQAMLARAGLWSKLAEHASGLQVMRIVDAGGPVAEPRVIKDFNAADISDLPFGWNLPNWLLRREILTRLEELPNVQFMSGVGTKSLFTRETGAKIGLSDGSRVTAQLVIAADGRNSAMRQAAGIDVSTTRYGQKALAFAVTHEAPHNNVSTEVHRSGGPFTLVPLPDFNGKPSSAIVWMERGAEVARLAALPEAAFNEEMTARSCAMYGPLELASKRTVWPIISQLADKMVGQRVALMAEAAHVVPPIGAQGLNMSLGDVRALLDLAEAAPDRLGDAAMLAAYEKERHQDCKIRVTGIDALNRASMMETQALRDLRAVGLNAIYSLPSVRRSMMQMGLGVR